MLRSLEPALRAISPFASNCADQILDLRDSALSAENPGRCVRCYFAIYHQVARDSADCMMPLRRWLERHIEIVARDESSERELERFPVRLDEGQDLRGFCERVMQEFHNDRAYPQSKVLLTFDFREDIRTAA